MSLGRFRWLATNTGVRTGLFGNAKLREPKDWLFWAEDAIRKYAPLLHHWKGSEGPALVSELSLDHLQVHRNRASSRAHKAFCGGHSAAG